MKTKKTPPLQILYTCPDDQVQVIRKTKGVRRHPAHNYPVILFLLRPQEGTRLQTLPDGRLEFMPNMNELRAVLAGIDSSLETVLPDDFQNKPRRRQLWWRKRNRQRHRNRRRK